MCRFLAPLALAAVLATGCASRATLDARYDASLAPWTGASRAQLLAAWGKPQADATLAGGDESLVYVAHHALEDPGRPAVVVASGVHGGIVDSGMPIAPVVPVTCTTRFLLHDGVVASWTFDGIACGAPG